MKKILIGFLFAINLFAAPDATIEVVKYLDKLPVIQVQDASDLGVDDRLRNNIFKLLIADLKITTYYEVSDVYTTANFGDSGRVGYGINIKTDLILRYKVSEELDGSIIAATKLINTRNGNVISERSFRISRATHYPFISHSIAINVVKDTGQEPVEWMDKYVLFSKSTGPNKSEIVIADYTLTYQQTIVRGGLNIFPKWADSTQNFFYYTNMNNEKPTIYKVSLMSGQRERIIDGHGMLVVSDVSSDGKKLLLTMSPNDQPDIYLYELLTKKLTRVTNYRGVDVSGSFADDDKRIIFVSDRLGYPNVFSTVIGSNAVEQMVYLGKNNSSATAYGRYIVYSGRDRASEFGDSTFNLYMISTQTEYIRQLTATGKNMFPRFSSDGGSIMFIKQYARESALGIVRLGANKSFYFPVNIGKLQSIDW